MAQRGKRTVGFGESANIKPPSIIAADLTIIGDIECDGAVHIDGLVEGDVTCGELSIGVRGRLKGHVTARFVKISGDLIGSVQAKRVFVGETSKVIGDVIHEILVVERGAKIEGYVRTAVNVHTTGQVDIREKIGKAVRAARPAQGGPMLFPPPRPGPRPAIEPHPAVKA